MNNNFFNIDAEDLYVEEGVEVDSDWKGARRFSSEEVLYSLLPDVVQRFKVQHGYVLAPALRLDSVLIPFDIFELDEKSFQSELISDLVSSVIGCCFGTKQLVASGSPEQFFFTEFKEFSFEFLNSFASCNLNTPFFIFDDSLNNCFGYDMDFEYCFLSSDKLTSQKHFGTEDLAEWDRFFFEHFPPAFAKITDNIQYQHQHICDTYLRPSLGR